GLEAHLDSEISGNARWEAMRVRLVEHVTLVFLNCLCFPLRVVRNLRAGLTGLGIDDSHVRRTAVDVGLRCRHPISREVGFAFTRGKTGPGGGGRSAATTTAWTALAAATAARSTLFRSCAATAATLADQHLAERQNHRDTEHDG